MSPCPDCGFPRVKNGVRKLKYRGNIQQWICNKCGNQSRDGEEKGRLYPKKVIDAAVSIRVDGLTLERTRKNIEKIFGIAIKSLTTIWNWVQIFTVLLPFIFMAMSNILHADETKIKTKKKGFYYWLWLCIEPITGIPTGWHLSETRSEEDTKRFLENVRSHLPTTTLNWPEKIRTDSMPSYYPAINKTFSREIKQDKFKSFKSHSNNAVENQHRMKNHLPRFGCNINVARKHVESFINELVKTKIGKLDAEKRKMIKVKFFAIYFVGFCRVLSCTK